MQVHFSKGFGNSWREAWKKLQLSRIKYQNQFKQCNFKLVELEATDQADINNIIQTLLAPFYQYWQRADITKFYSPWKRLIDNHINEANYQKLLDWCLHAKQQGDDVTIPGSLHTQLWEYITEIIPTQLPSHSRYYEYETWLTQNFPGQKYSISEIMSFIKYQGINIDIILSKQKKTAFIEALTNNHLAWAIALISHGASSAIYEIDVLMKLLSPFYENRSHHNQLRKMIKILGNNNITLVKLLNDKLSLKSLTNRAFKLLQAKTSSNNKQILELETQEILLQQSIAKINNTYQQSTDNDCKLACAKILASIESNFSDAFLRSLAILVAQTNIDKIHHATNTSIVKKLLGQPVFRRALETNIYKILSDETAETDSRLAMIDLSLKMGYSADDICNLLVAQLFTKNRVVGQKS
ncbi:MAG: hypothetical protein HWD59_01480 [Coxiellaceae bacterium]|nr:MAG: hypothetical protein HWD59_01480 [Coxiellaceae bacterium]